MSAAVDPAFIGDLPPRRRNAQPAPLDLWRRTLMVVLALTISAGLWFEYGRTPMPVTLDSVAFDSQLAGLDRQVREARSQGQNPITIVFLGTSRMRNVGLDTAAIDTAARQAGVKRPIASTTIGIDWGGFERFAPVLDGIKQHHPDVVVIMPELLRQDFTSKLRLQLGLAWLASLMWNKDFQSFPIHETTTQVCLGFDHSAAERDADDQAYVYTDPHGPGPKQARSFLREIARGGTRIFVVEIPVTPELAAVRPPAPHGLSMLAASGLTPAEATAVSFSAPLDRTAYCDYAHLNPARADVWRHPFFAAVATKLNGLGN